MKLKVLLPFIPAALQKHIASHFTLSRALGPLAHSLRYAPRMAQVLFGLQSKSFWVHVFFRQRANIIHDIVCCVCKVCFSFSRQNDAEINYHFAKWWALDPKHGQSVKKVRIGSRRRIQDLFRGCPGNNGLDLEITDVAPGIAAFV